MGPRNAFTLSNALAGGATVFLWIAEANDAIEEVPVLILVAKFGVCSFFAMLYMNTLVYFPTQYLGAVFGICNIASRAITILAPMVAELDQPAPELSLILICFLAVIFSRYLKIPDSMQLKEGDEAVAESEKEQDDAKI